MVSKRRPARTIHKPSGEATGLVRQAAEDDALDGKWQGRLTISRDKAKNPRDSGRAKGRTMGAGAAEKAVRAGGGAGSSKALTTGAARRRGDSGAKKARETSSRKARPSRAGGSR